MINQRAEEKAEQKSCDQIKPDGNGEQLSSKQPTEHKDHIRSRWYYNDCKSEQYEVVWRTIGFDILEQKRNSSSTSTGIRRKFTNWIFVHWDLWVSIYQQIKVARIRTRAPVLSCQLLGRGFSAKILERECQMIIVINANYFDMLSHWFLRKHARHGVLTVLNRVYSPPKL